MEMDSSPPERRFDGREEVRSTPARDCDHSCESEPDFIEDVLLQKGLYASNNTMEVDPAYEPTYTFTNPDIPTTDSNPISLINEADKQQTLVTGEHGTVSDPSCLYGADKGTVTLTVNPIFDAVLDCNHEEQALSQVYQEHMSNDFMWAGFSGADNDILRKAICLCTDENSQVYQEHMSNDLDVVDALQLTLNDIPMERTLEACRVEEEPPVQVGREDTNIDLVGSEPLGIDKKIIAEPVENGNDLGISDIPQLSMDAIPMESILEGSDYEEVSLIQLGHKNVSNDLLDQIFSSIGNGIVSTRIGGDNDQSMEKYELGPQGLSSPAVIGMTEGEGSPRRIRSKQALQDDSELQQLDCHRRSCSESCSGSQSPINPKDPQRKSPSQSSICSKNRKRKSRWQSRSPTDSKRDLQGASPSQCPISSRDSHRKSWSLSRGRSPSISSTRPPIESRDCYRRSQSKSRTNSRDGHRRSRSYSRYGLYSKDCRRRSYSRSQNKSRDSHQRSRLQLHSGINSRDCIRRTGLGSRSPINLGDLQRRFRSRSPIGIRDFHRRSRSRSPISIRDLRRPSPRTNRPRPRSPLPPKREQNLHRRSSSRSPTPQKRHSSSSPQVRQSTWIGKRGKELYVTGFARNATEGELERKFSEFGSVTSARIVKPRSGRTLGCGFVSMSTDHEADAAIRALDGSVWNNKVLAVEKEREGGSKSLFR